jgi:hypothetical protein
MFCFGCHSNKSMKAVSVDRQILWLLSYCRCPFMLASVEDVIILCRKANEFVQPQVIGKLRGLKEVDLSSNPAQILPISFPCWRHILVSPGFDTVVSEVMGAQPGICCKFVVDTNSTKWPTSQDVVCLCRVVL